MTKNDTARTLAAIACTIVMSATCLLGALAPAHVGDKPVAAATQVA